MTAIPTQSDVSRDSSATLTPGLAGRSAFGGLLMGLANLVPGISGGTMLLAAGIYPDFIDAIASLSRFKVRLRSCVVLGVTVGCAALGILVFAGVLKDLVVQQRWIMYSLFVGLTLGGLPVVWKMASPASVGLIVSAVLAFACMVGLVLCQAAGVIGDLPSNAGTLFCAGVAGACAMVLPGISGGYLLLLMGQYVPILTGINGFKVALRARDFAALSDPLFSLVLPVGLGVVVGVVAVGNVLQWLLIHCRKATLGALLGLLVGSAVGLWPFQSPVAPQIGDTVKGQVVTEAILAELDPGDWPTEYFRPKPQQVGMSLLLIATGLATTWGISRIGEGKQD